MRATVSNLSGLLVVMLGTVATSTAQVPDYNGVWMITPPLPNGPTLFVPADRVRIVAQAPGIAIEFGSASGYPPGSLTGQLISTTSATAAAQTPPGQCTLRFAATLTFTGQDQASGILQSTDVNGCYWRGSLTQSFTAQRVSTAMYRPFAAACAGAGPRPTLSATVPPSLSSGFTVTLTNVPANLALLATGLSNTVSGSLALPLDLTSRGMNGCNLHVSPDALQMITGGPTVPLTMAFPNTAGLLGVTFFQQAFVPDPAASPVGATMSNAMVAVIGA